MLLFAIPNDETFANERASEIDVTEAIVRDAPNETEATIYITNEQVTLEGLTSAVDLHVNIPHDYVTDDATLTLKASYSSLLEDNSSVTVHIDGEKLASEKINPNKTSLQMEVSIPKKLLTKGFHTITVLFYGIVTDDICANEDNPGNWFTILPSSSLQLKQLPLKGRTNMLEHFPYPFVQTNRAEQIRSTIVIPNEPSIYILEAAMKVANFLNNAVTTSDNVQIVTEDELTNVDHHLIAIGSHDDWSGEMKKWTSSLEDVAESSAFTLQNIILQHANKAKLLLYIYAPMNEQIAMNIDAIANDTFVEQLTGNSLSIQKLPDEQPEQYERTMTFKQLQIPNLYLTGKKTTTDYYFIRTPPAFFETGETFIKLFLNASETLFIEKEQYDHDDAELVVFVNDVPHSVAIRSLKKEADDGFYTVHVPIDPIILQQEPYVSLHFEAHGLHDHDICVPPNEDRWIYVHKASYVTLPEFPNERNATFGDWPVPYVATEAFGKNAIIIPDKIDENIIEQLYMLTSQLGRYGSIQHVQLYTDDGNLADQLTDYDIIALGDLEQLPSIMALDDALLIPQSNDGSFDLTSYNFIQETLRHIAWQQTSPWNKDKLMTVFTTGTNENTFISESLIEFIQKNLPHTAVIVESKNGEIFTDETSLHVENKASDEIERGSEKRFQTEINPFFIGGFFLLLGVSLFLFIYIIRRQRRNKT